MINQISHASHKWIEVVDAFATFKAIAAHADPDGYVQMSDQECVRWRNELLKSNPLLDDRDLNLIAFMAQKHLK